MEAAIEGRRRLSAWHGDYGSSMDLTGPITANISSISDLAYELEVLNIISRLGLYPTHSGSYRDPVTGKHREFDVRFDTGPVSCHTFSSDKALVTVECKSLSTGRPLLVSTRESDREVSMSQLEWQGNGRTANMSITQYDIWREPRLVTGTVNRFVCENIGVECNQIESSNGGSTIKKLRNSEVFDKWSQALSSLGGYVDNEYGPRYTGSQGQESALLCPIMVVPDGTLYVYDTRTQTARNDLPFIHYKVDATLVTPSRYDGELMVRNLVFCTTSGLTIYLKRVLGI